MTLKSDCFVLIKNAIEAINPQKLIKNNLTILNGNTLIINNKHEYQLNKNVYIAAFGKAVSSMCIEVEDIVKDHLVKGIAVVPIGSNKITNSTKIQFFYGAHNNIPDRDAYEGAKEIYSMCKSLQKDDLLIACVTGGGSALLPLPVDDITLEEKILTTKVVASAGANINELNTIRGCLSKLKCGGLARTAYPANIVSLIISDVIDDPLDIIASGPTYIADSNGLKDKFNKSLSIVEKYSLNEKLPESVLKYLDENSKKENEFDDKAVKDRIQNFLIGNNKLALEATCRHAIELQFNPSIILTNTLDGEAKEAAKYFSYLAFIINNFNFYKNNEVLFKQILENNLNQDQLKLFNKFLLTCLKEFSNDGVSNRTKRLCILSGGETTVKLTDIKTPANSLGGRNQEMALAFKKHLIDIYKQVLSIHNNNISIGQFLFTSFGTDGIDGPTDAAGAIVSNQSDFDVNDNDNIEFMNKCLREHNSYKYFEKNNGLIKVGHTGTNVSDIQMLLLQF